LHTLAEVFGKRREYERALDAMQRAKGLIVSVVGAVPYHQWTADIYRKQAAEIPDPAERERLLRSAVAELREALARTPKPDVDVQIRTDLVACLSQLLEVDEALAEQRVAVRIGAGLPREGERYYSLGRMLEDHGDIAEAEDQLIAAKSIFAKELAEAPDDGRTSIQSDLAGAANSLAWLYVERYAKLDDAQRLADQAVEAASRSGDAQLLADCTDTRGWIAYRSGHVDQAVTDFTEALQVLGIAERWAHLALALEARSLQQQEYEEGARDLDRASDIWRHITDRFPDDVWSERSREHLNQLNREDHVPLPLVESP